MSNSPEEPKGEELSGDQLQTLCQRLLTNLLLNVGPDGRLGDGDAPVLTHHALMALAAWRSLGIASIEDLCVRWFLEGLDDPRERAERSFNPFKLFALVEAGRSDQQEYIDQKCDVLRRYHVKAGGWAVLQLGFTMAGDVQDVFPSLMAAELLLNHGSSESVDTARTTFEWCREQLDAEAVYQNVDSITGFSALVAAKLVQRSPSAALETWIDNQCSRLGSRQKAGLWQESRYQSAYILYDLTSLAELGFSEAVKGMLEPGIRACLHEAYFDDEEVAGQNLVIVSCSLLRAFAKVLGPERRAQVVHRVLADGLAGFREYGRRHAKMNLKEREINRVFKALLDNSYIPVNPTVFTKRNFAPNPKRVFVLMPFGEKQWLENDAKTGQPTERSNNFDLAFHKVVQPAVEELGLECARADSIFAPHPFMEKIWGEINEACLVLADMTSSNGNVLYELGLAHTLGKPVIMLTQDGRYVPTDLKGIEYVQYKSELGGEDEVRKKLQTAIKQTLQLEE